MFRSIWLRLKKLAFILWVLFMAFMGAGLAVFNDQMVSVSLFVISFPQTSLGMVICVSLLIGAVLGFITSYLVLKPGLVVNKRALKKANKEVANLRTKQSP